MAYTSISFRDPFLDAKVCVQQYPFGTGAFSSTLDCVPQLRTYVEASLWSGDEAFKDNVDPEWIFFFAARAYPEIEFIWRCARKELANEF